MNANNPPYMDQNGLFKYLVDNPHISMIWGDIGTGKTTLALQFSKYVIDQKHKVIFLNTKQSPILHLISRIIGDIWDSPESNFIYREAFSLKAQTQAVMDFNLDITQIHGFLKDSQIGLIIMDEISNNYLLEFSTETRNKKLNQSLTTQLATLANISQKHNLPILLLNSFSLKKIVDEQDLEDQDENRPHFKEEEQQATPHGGQLIDYWVQTSIKIMRTAHTSVMNFQIIKNPDGLNSTDNWSWELREEGFD